MTTVQSDYELLLARVDAGELGTGNLIQMILDERSRNAELADAVREWQVIATASRSLIRDGNGIDREQSELVELILWLALPWADNDPIFPESDGWTPVALEANVRMARTWQKVVRSNKSEVAVTTEKGEAHGL
jgi:hypothetical protein